MGVSDKEYDLIINYIDEELTDQQQSEFTQLMNDSEKFSKEVRMISNMHESILLAGRSRRFVELKTLFNEWDQERLEKTRRSRLKRMMLMAATITGIILMAFSKLFFFDRASGKELYAEYYEPFHFNFNTRSETSLKQLDAFLLYNSFQYEKAIPALLALDTIDIQVWKKHTAKIFLANAYMQVGENNKARSILENATFSHQEQLLNDCTTWYLSLIYLHIDQRSKAITELKKLSSSISFKKKAKELLSKVE